MTSKHATVVIISEDKKHTISYNSGINFIPLEINNFKDINFLSISKNGQYAVALGINIDTNKETLFLYDTYLRKPFLFNHRSNIYYDENDYFFTTQDGRFSFYSDYDAETYPALNQKYDQYIPYNKMLYRIYDKKENKSISFDEFMEKHSNKNSEKERFEAFKKLNFIDKHIDKRPQINNVTLDGKYLYGTVLKGNGFPKYQRIGFVYNVEKETLNVMHISNRERGESKINAVSDNNIFVGWYEFFDKDKSVLNRQAFFYKPSEYSITDIPTLISRSSYSSLKFNSEATDISDNGNLIVGWSEYNKVRDRDGEKYSNAHYLRSAFIYERTFNKTHELGNLINGDESEALSISGDGSIVYGVAASKRSNEWKLVSWRIKSSNKEDLPDKAYLTDEEKQRQAEAEAKRIADEAKQRQVEAEAKRIAEEAKQRQAEAEAKRIADEAKQRQEEAEAKRIAEEAKQRQAEAEAKRIADEAKQRQAEAEAKRIADEAKQRQAEAEAKRIAEEAKQRQEEAETKRIADEAKQRQEEAEAKRIAEEAKQRKEEAEAKRITDEAKQRQEEAETKRIADEKATLDANTKAKEERAPIPSIIVSKPIDIENTYKSMQLMAENGYKIMDMQQGQLRYLASATCSVGTEKACISGFTHYQQQHKANATQTGLSGAYRIDINKIPLVVGLAIDTDIYSSLPKGYKYQGYALPLLGFSLDLIPSLNTELTNNALHLSLKGAYLNRKVSIERPQLEDTEAGKGNARLSGYHIELQGYYPYLATPQLTLTPFIGLTFKEISRSAYSETKDVDFIAHYEKLNEHAFLAKLGLGLDYLLTQSITLNTKAGMYWQLAQHQRDFRSHIDYLGQQNLDYADKKKHVKQRPFANVGMTYQFDKHSSIKTSANWEMTTYRNHDMQFGVDYTYRF
nr:autotransporter domain-containing protein [Proteus myxofaciens]